jgi:hypothetical protein
MFVRCRVGPVSSNTAMSMAAKCPQTCEPRKGLAIRNKLTGSIDTKLQSFLRAYVRISVTLQRRISIGCRSFSMAPRGQGEGTVAAAACCQ